MYAGYISQRNRFWKIYFGKYTTLLQNALLIPFPILCYSTPPSLSVFVTNLTEQMDFYHQMSSSLASVVSLHPGECYSIAGVTTSQVCSSLATGNDQDSETKLRFAFFQHRLALLLSGCCTVSSPRLGNLGKVGIL